MRLLARLRCRLFGHEVYSITHACGTTSATTCCRCGVDPKHRIHESEHHLRLTRLPNVEQPPLPDIETFFECNPDCTSCHGEGAVCEDHPDRPWNSGSAGDCDCGAMGIPCRPENRQGGIRKTDLSLRFCTEDEWGSPDPEMCEDCTEGEHQTCQEGGGWPHQDSNERCPCHLLGHPVAGQWVRLEGGTGPISPVDPEAGARLLEEVGLDPEEPE